MTAHAFSMRSAAGGLVVERYVLTKNKSQGLKDLSLPVLDFVTERIQEEDGEL